MALEVKRFGRVREVMAPPNLMKLQVESYSRFLQPNLPPDEREPMGLEGILSEIFPIESYDKSLSLEYLGYDLGRPRYSTDDCRKLRKTYGMPFKIRVRLVKGSEAKEEDVYLGEIPMMIGGGEFIVNGSERVIVSQLHRSPGVDFDKEIHTSDKVLHKCRVIPERGSWIEINVSKRDALTVRIDQSGKFPVTCLVRALFPEYATNEDIIRLFYKTKRVKMSTKSAVSQIAGKVGVSDIVDETTGEIKAEGGSLFLDEVGDMPPEAQTRLLRVLQDGEYLPVGANRPVKANVRIIAATNHNLQYLMQQGLFREDLFYRLNVVPLRLPPLRERTEDIAPLVNHFQKQAAAGGLPAKRFVPEAIRALAEWNWPGNVRELENLVRRLLVLVGEDSISAEMVEVELASMRPAEAQPIEVDSLAESVDQHVRRYFSTLDGAAPPAGLHGRILREVEYPLIVATLEVTRGNQVKAAEILGINRNTLRKRIRELGIWSGR